MPGEASEKRSSAGISSADASAVFERLKDEVRRPPEAPRNGGRDRSGLTARSDAERLWSVAVDRPIQRRPGVRGALVYPLKRVLRKLMSWYVGPFAAEQRSFNAAVLRVADELSVRLDELRADLEHEAAERLVLETALADLQSRVDVHAAAFAEAEDRDSAAARLLEELQERFVRLERRPQVAVADASASTVAAPAEPDYFAFEARMRGSTVEIRTRQADYLDDFRDCAPVLDIGCGRGEFLQLLRDAGIEARGVDSDPDMVAFCRGAGLDVAESDATAYLHGLPDGELGGVFCAHVLEHFAPGPLLQLLDVAGAKLRSGGLFVAETPNPRTLVALSTFFADLTHAQPLHPETLSFLVRQAGFRDVHVRYLNEPPPEGRLRHLPPGDEAANANVDRLNEVLFGPQDYAVLARA